MDRWSKAALLLVGHGSSLRPEGRAATVRLAEAIRRRGIFAEVQECFCKEPPYPSLDLASARLIYVVPNFAGVGNYTNRLIPQRLGLTGRVTIRAGRRVVYCDPVGSHPGVATLLQRRAEELCRTAGASTTATALLVIGHGARSGDAGRTPEAVAAALRASGRFAEVATAFIEQEPRVAQWPRLVRATQVIAAPLLISEGMHANEDLPPLFGLSTPIGGPIALSGRTVWLMGGLGRDPEVVEMILDLVRAADSTMLETEPP